MQINILFVHRGCHVSRLLFPPKQESLTPAGLFLSLVTKGFRNSKQLEKRRRPPVEPSHIYYIAIDFSLICLPLSLYP